jgi:hypothetical protein
MEKFAHPRKFMIRGIYFYVSSAWQAPEVNPRGAIRWRSYKGFLLG